MLKKFTVKNLYHAHDLSIDTTKKCCIVVGQNGVGKTTVLKMLNWFAKGDVLKIYSGSIVKTNSMGRFNEPYITIGRSYATMPSNIG